ncbi:invasion associated locus B family protein [Roseobacter sp. HKCCA0434]|uniref:invasion associated locus B family protein n=1 Tax=Roseobacter sp. HKCCA0434 TaxID=3079297 RepID=UPI002905B68B|nr:invasion associated locus B family protein [Roseobacter sp. HKCCA0434]
MRALACLLAALATPSVAEEVSRHRDWSLDCRATGVDQTSCVLAQRLISPDTEAEIAQIVLRAREDGTALVLRVPTGVDLTRRPAFEVDDGTAQALTWTACDANHCLAATALDAERSQALRDGVTATFGYQPLSAEAPLLFDVSLLGISAGWDALLEQSAD